MIIENNSVCTLKCALYKHATWEIEWNLLD